MAKAREKGKIPHGEWPKILARYTAGATIAEIGRHYGCTAPAIRYIIKRTGSLRSDSGNRSGPSGVDAVSPSRIAAMGGAGERHFPAELTKRVTGDVVAFLAALDQVALDGSPENLALLEEAIDSLMRSAARTRIELARLLASRRSKAAKEAERKEPSLHSNV